MIIITIIKYMFYSLLILLLIQYGYNLYKIFSWSSKIESTIDTITYKTFQSTDIIQIDLFDQHISVLEDYLEQTDIYFLFFQLIKPFNFFSTRIIPINVRQIVLQYEDENKEFFI